MATTPAKRACSVCGTLLADDSAYCPVCALRRAVETQSDSVSNLSHHSKAAADTSFELRFEHYQVLRNQDGKPLELGHGGMGVTYKAIDTHLGCPVALKIISAQFLGKESARSRFLREARAAASVRHSNVIVHTTYDFTSLLKLVETAFGLSPLTGRDGSSNDMLKDCFNLNQAPLPPLILQ